MRQVPTRLHFVSSLGDVRLPDPHVAVCDRSVEGAVRPHLRNALFVSGGEAIKSLSAVERLASSVLRRCSDRSLTLAAVGGGSVGDAVGFLASVLWRGVDLVQIPTTLLSMADSAHGGKTAANLRAVKNQLGTFWFPKEIWIVGGFLKTMPPPLLRDGLSEIVKAAFVGDAATARRFLDGGIGGVPVEKGLRAAIRVKSKIVGRDPFDRLGVRAFLNLGHTLGHALETTAGLGHGASVAWGLACAALISRSFGFKEADRTLRMLRPLLEAPRRWPGAGKIESAMRMDKKRDGTKLRSVVLKAPGRPLLTTEISPSDWVDALSETRKVFDA